MLDGLHFNRFAGSEVFDFPPGAMGFRVYLVPVGIVVVAEAEKGAPCVGGMVQQDVGLEGIGKVVGRFPGVGHAPGRKQGPAAVPFVAERPCGEDHQAETDEGDEGDGADAKPDGLIEVDPHRDSAQGLHDTGGIDGDEPEREGVPDTRQGVVAHCPFVVGEVILGLRVCWSDEGLDEFELPPDFW